MLAPLHGLLIGFLGTGLYIAVDRYEPNRILASLLKGLIVSLAILTVLADFRAVGAMNSPVGAAKAAAEMGLGLHWLYHWIYERAIIASRRCPNRPIHWMHELSYFS